MSGVLHDLKTPMTIVSGYAQLMASVRRRRAAQPLRRAHLEAVRPHVGDDARAPAVRARRVEAAGAQGLPAEVAARDARAARARARRQEGRARRRRRATRARPTFDENKMFRVIHNLARNAAQAMEGGGRFTITVDTDGPELMLSFADTGARHPRGDAAGASSRPSPPPASATAPASASPSSRRSSTSTAGASATRASRGVGTTFRVALPLARPAS